MEFLSYFDLGGYLTLKIAKFRNKNVIQFNEMRLKFRQIINIIKTSIIRNELRVTKNNFISLQNESLVVYEYSK